MKFSYIIGFRHSNDRLRNLKSVLKWSQNFDCEMIVVESDVISKISNLQLEYNFQHIFVDNSLPYNRSWMYNIGYKHSVNNYFLFGDADLIMNATELKTSISLLNEFDCVNPYSEVIDLNNEETLHYLEKENISFLNSINRGGRRGVNMCGGLVAFTRKGFEKVGGWDENFWGWGGEDDFMTIKTQHFLSYKNCRNKCYHLKHEDADKTLLYRNISILRELFFVGKDNLRSYIDTIEGKIGDIDKLKKFR